MSVRNTVLYTVAILVGFGYPVSGRVFGEEIKITFSIDGGPALEALLVFAEQSESDLIFENSEIADIQTNPVSGELAPSEALQIMLRGTPLGFIEDLRSGAFAVERLKENSRKLSNAQTSGNLVEPSTNNNSEQQDTQDMKPNTSLIGKMISVLIATSTTTAMVAQDNATSYEEDIFELSPFVVSAEDSDGYLASSSLTGTRIKTNLEDIASSITVVTPLLMEDTDVQDLNDLFQFTANTEAAGEDGNYSGGGGNTFIQNPSNAQRVRGLAPASLSRNLFRTTLSWDSYNLSQVEIVRGANSILFGQGSPAGIVNANLIQPMFKERYRISFRIDNNSSFRTVLDANVPVIEDTLAVRASFLINNKKFRQKPAYEDDHRMFLTAVWKLTDNLTLRANTEQVKIGASRPNLISPDDGITDYLALLGPYADPDPNLSVGEPYVDYPGNPETGRPGVENVAAAQVGSFLQFGHVFEVDASFAGSTPEEYSFQSIMNPPSIASNPILPRARYRYNFSRFSDQYYSGTGVIGVARRSFQDYSVYDWKNNYFWGNYSFQDRDYETYQAKLQYLSDKGNFGVELAFDSQTEAFDTNGGVSNSIRLDVSELRFDGTPNPNVLRPAASIGFNENAINKQEVDNETAQLTAFAKFDFVEDAGWDNFFGRLLGQHTATFLLSNNEFLDQTHAYDQTWVGDGMEYNAGTGLNLNRVPGHNHRKNTGYIYLGPAVSSVDDLQINTVQFSSGDIFQDGQLYPIHHWEKQELQWVTREYASDFFLEEYQYEKTETETKAAILQSNFWNDHIVTTLGYRKDDLTLTNRFFNYVPETQIVDPEDYTDTIIAGGGEYFSWGIVVKSPRNWNLPLNTNISAFYSESENFNPAATGRLDSLGRSIDPPTGLTKDYGFRIETLNNKLSMKFNLFETESTLNSFGGGPLSQILQFDFRFRELSWVPLEAAGLIAPDDNTIEAYDASHPQGIVDAFNAELQSDGMWSYQTFGATQVTDTSDNSAEGYEIEIVYNPTRNWRILANVSKQETVRANSLAGFVDYLEERFPYFKETFNYPYNYNGLTSEEIFLTPEGYLDTAAYAKGGPGYEVSRGARYESNVIIPLEAALSQDGRVVNEQRKWRVNIVTNYAFDQDSTLAGFEIGGYYRWQDASAIGYPLVENENGDLRYDVTNPFFGDEISTTGLWLRYATKLVSGKVGWTIQLNVNNLFESGDPIPVNTNAWGEYGAVRIPNLRSWSITNRFTF